VRTLFLVLLLFSGNVLAEGVAQIRVTRPYLELHTGPGEGYPIFYVVDRGEYVDVLVRKTDWFLVRTRKHVEGWVSRAQIEETTTTTGEKAELKELSLNNYSNRRWEVGLVGGIFNNSPVMTFYTGYALMQNLSAELSISKVTADYSSSQLVNFNLMSEPFNDWRYSPFFTLGIGQIQTKPRTTLVLVKDRTDFIAHVGVGVKAYLTKRFILRAEYKNYVAFSSNDKNEEFEEWKAGFAFFF
jgi:uncharacterized protein YraI